MLKKLNLLQRIAWRIAHKSTGTPEEFADKLAISTSSLHRHLKALKEEWNAPIEYSEVEKSYYYSATYSFEDELLKILKKF
ncbi:MAG: hypothetical protein OHK0057_34710 [Thermoflexibacter sp.]